MSYETKIMRFSYQHPGKQFSIYSSVTQSRVEIAQDLAMVVVVLQAIAQQYSVELHSVSLNLTYGQLKKMRIANNWMLRVYKGVKQQECVKDYSQRFLFEKKGKVK